MVKHPWSSQENLPSQYYECAPYATGLNVVFVEVKARNDWLAVTSGPKRELENVTGKNSCN